MAKSKQNERSVPHRRSQAAGAPVAPSVASSSDDDHSRDGSKAVPSPPVQIPATPPREVSPAASLLDSDSSSEPATSPVRSVPSPRPSSSNRKQRYGVRNTLKRAAQQKAVSQKAQAGVKKAPRGAKKAQPLKKKGKAVPKPGVSVAKPKKRTPYGTKALKAIIRDDTDPVPEDLMDVDYRPPTKSAATPSILLKPETRRDSQHFVKIVDTLPEKPEDFENPDEEVEDYNIFVEGLRKQGVKVEKVGRHDVYSNDKAVWLSTSCRYKSRDVRVGTVTNCKEKEFWRTKNGGPDVLSKELKILMDTKTVPICILVGQQEQTSSNGHAATLVFVPEDGKWQPMVKDSTSPGLASMMNIVHDLVRKCGFRRCELTAALDIEEHCIGPQCLKMAYEVVANIFQGKPFFKRNIVPFSSTWDVYAKKKIKK